MGVNGGDDGNLGHGGMVLFGVRWCGVMAWGVVVCEVGVETVVVRNVDDMLVGDANGVMNGEALGIDD